MMQFMFLWTQKRFEKFEPFDSAQGSAKRLNG